MLDAMTGKSSSRDFISTTLLCLQVSARLANLSFAVGLFSDTTQDCSGDPNRQENRS